MRKVIAVFLALPLLLFPAAALADDDGYEEDETEEHVIGPQVIDESETVSLVEPIDINSVVITRQTPADQFVMATTPLVLALAAGSIGLVIYTVARSSNREDKD